MQITNIQAMTQTMEPKYNIASENVLFRKVGNEGVLLHLSSGTYFSLNETSILFWDALSNEQSLISVVDQVVDEYDVDRTQVLEDLKEFLTDLESYDLIFPASN